jgi:hypothetical protein
MAMALSTTEAFRSPKNPPCIMPRERREERSRTTQNKDRAAVFQAKQRLKKPKYDLGIGRNKVVNFDMAVSPGNQNNQYVKDAVGVGKYIVEHEGVQEFPSPIREGMIEPVPSATKWQVLPKVHPSRKVSDLFDISSLTDDALPVMIARYDSSTAFEHGMVEPLKLDPNTVWVEMMLHDEIHKLVSINHE